MVDGWAIACRWLLISQSSTNNSHIAEERVMNLASDGSAGNEEDKYVVIT